MLECSGARPDAERATETEIDRDKNKARTECTRGYRKLTFFRPRKVMIV